MFPDTHRIGRHGLKDLETQDRETQPSEVEEPDRNPEARSSGGGEEIE